MTELAETVGISFERAQKIIVNELGFSKIFTRWVLRLLSVASVFRQVRHYAPESTKQSKLLELLEYYVKTFEICVYFVYIRTHSLHIFHNYKFNLY